MSASSPNSEDLASPLRPEVSKGFAVSNRTVPRHHNRWPLLAAFAVGLVLILMPAAVHAFYCTYEDTYWISLCKEGACTQGFTIEHRSIPHYKNRCKTRPVVRDLTDTERANFKSIIQQFEHEVPNGIYQLLASHSCLRYGWRNANCLRQSFRERRPNGIFKMATYDGCRKNGRLDAQCLATYAPPITRLSDVSDAQTLAQHRSEWLAKERQAVRDNTIRTWRMAIVFILFTLFSLAWPWLLVAFKSSLKRYLVYMSIAAIPGQAFVFLFIWVYRNAVLGGQILEWPRLALICQSLIVLVVTLQFGFFIWQKLKPKSQKRIPASSS